MNYNKKIYSLLNLSLFFKNLDLISIFLLLAAYISGIILIISADKIYWVTLFTDDAYYYLGIARNIIDGNGSKFLPPFSTNGYQPFLLSILVVLGYVFGSSIITLSVILLTITFASLLLFSAVSKIKFGYFFPGILLAFSYIDVVMTGMETIILPIFFIIFYLENNWFKKGIFASLLLLTRLDSMAIFFSDALVNLINKRKNIQLHYLVVLIPVFLIYFVFNYIFFGSALPISGLSKSIGNIKTENIQVFTMYLRAFKLPLILGLIVIGLRKFNFKSPLRFGREILTLLITTVVCSLYYTVFSGWPIWGWYYWPFFLLSYFTLLEIAYLLRIARNNLVLKLLASLFLFSILFVPVIKFFDYRFILFRDYINNQVDATNSAVRNAELVNYIKNKNIIKNSFFVMGDRAGSFGFFLGPDYQFFHTEGLVSSRAYYDAMRKDDGLNFLLKYPIDYFVVDREIIYDNELSIGIIEPVQGLSSHIGPWLICFSKEGILLDQSYDIQKRYFIDFKSRIECPAEFDDNFKKIKGSYGGVSEFSFPSLYGSGNFRHYLKNYFNIKLPTWWRN